MTHLEVMWELPELACFLERLGSMGRVIIFGKRGTGLSFVDRDVHSLKGVPDTWQLFAVA